MSVAAEGTLYEKAVAGYQKVCGRRFGFRTRNNLSLPIHKLPADILSRIFTIAVATLADDEKVVGRKKAIGRLAGVCHTWQEIVYNTPRMWNTFTISCMKLAWAETMLARSKATLLRIKCPTPLTDQAISSALSLHLGRMIELELTADPSILSELFTTSSALPTGLQSLRLRSCSGNMNLELIPRVLPMQMPFLQTLELAGIPLPHNLPPLPRLRLLSLSCPVHYRRGLVSSRETLGEVGPGMLMDTLLSFLESTPSLEELEVHCVLSRSTPKLRIPSFKPVELPRLSQISFMSQHGENIAFFARIQYPPSVRVQIKCTKDHRQTSLAIDDLDAILSYFSSSQDAALADHASFASDFCRLRLQTSINGVPSLDIHLAVENSDNPGLFRLLSVLPCSNVQTLHIDTYCFLSSIPSIDWTNVLRGYENVRELSLNRVVARFILGLIPNDDDPAPLPRLKILKIRLGVFYSEQREGSRSREGLTESLERFFQERNRYDIPLDVLEIIEPLVRMKPSTVHKLRQYVQVVFGSPEM